ncbi:collagen-like protein [Streptomyces sp. NPDC017943]|uniref:collagen-like protein n=1 Tax=Streptomyces sp. NPDC017943 TaxID=3365019 RepID=UPI0037B9C212
MTRAERTLARRWRSVLLVCTLVALSGAVLIIWSRIEHEAARAEELAVEADRRGEAVSTLAGDVRLLRAQVKNEGATPAAPDPADAIEDLPARAEVPVPIPGPRGPSGPSGVPGRDGQDGSDGEAGTTGEDGSPGRDGQPGEAGKDGAQGATGPVGPAGPPGPAGKDGADGKDGAPGRDGQTCPDGYSLQTPSWDAEALVCRRDGAPDPEPSPGPGPLAAGLEPYRRQYA